VVVELEVLVDEDVDEDVEVVVEVLLEEVEVEVDVANVSNSLFHIAVLPEVFCCI